MSVQVRSHRDRSRLKTEGHAGQFKLDHIDPCSKRESHAGQFKLEHIDPC